ncbi:MAG: WbqC family protein [Bacteroidales bacterium]|nr:WbqC family protein [Bacteroidales bacterium]
MNERKTAWFPTAYWPPLAFFSVVYPYGNWIVEQHEHYTKQTVRNRCSICGANGPQWLIVPVKRKRGSKTPIRDVMLDLSQDWQRNHWLAIESAYSSSPYYEYYKDEIRPFYTRTQPTSLFDYNLSILTWCLEVVQAQVSVKLTDTYMAHYSQTDYRNTAPRVRSVPYYQVFSQKLGFVPQQSILDLIMNEGPESWKVLDVK